MKGIGVVLAFSAAAVWAADTTGIERARELYEQTDYQASLNLLQPLDNSSVAALRLTGQNYYMLGQYKKATEAFDRALAMGDSSEDLYVWAGRAYGRRAETSGPFTAGMLATRARKYFETAVSRDILNREATGDLLDYYLGAPAFLGGGIDKARELAQKVAAADPPEGQHMLAELAEHDKRYGDEEQHLRRAIELAPREAGRVVELARFVAKRGRFKESDQLFDQAQHIAPQNHRILFYRAQTYIEDKRNLNDAQALLESYVKAPLTPEDPPRQKAQELLKKAQVGP